MAGPSSPGARVPFTDQDRDYMIKYLAKYTTNPQGRSGNEIWKTLKDNKRHKWDWANRHTWQSWRNHYAKDREFFDRKVRKYQQKNPTLQPLASDAGPSSSPGGGAKRVRVAFTASDDEHLAEYLAEHSLTTPGRLGNKLYKTLAGDEEGKWPWASRHTFQSWRERYKNRRETFDEYIQQRQLDRPPRAVFETPTGSRQRRRRVKRASSELDEPIPEEREEPEEANANEAKVREARKEEEEESQETEMQEAESVAGEEHEVEEAIRRREKDASLRLSSTPSQQGSETGQTGTKRRRTGESDDGVAELSKIKRRRVEDNGGTIAQNERTTEADAGIPTRDERRTEIPQARSPQRVNGKLPGVPPREDDYTGDIFDPRDSSDNETEDEEDDQQQEHPPIAIKQEEGEEDQEDQPAPSAVEPGDQRQIDVDVDAIASIKQEPVEFLSPGGAPSPTTVSRAKDSSDRLYPSLPPPSPRITDVEELSLPGQFPTTSTPVHVRGASVVSEAIPLAHELLEKKADSNEVSQNPTPPASSPPVEDMAPVKHKYAHKATRQPITPRARPPAPKAKHRYLRKPSEEIFASVASTPVIPSSRDVTPSPQRQERRFKRPREPPRLDDGPYNHVFTDAMGRVQPSGARPTGVAVDEGSDRGDRDEEVRVWPPLRGRDKGKRKVQQEQTNARPPIASDVQVKTESQEPVAALRQLPAQSARTHHPFSQPTQDLGASQDSQAQYSQSQHHVFSQPSQRVVSAERSQSEPQETGTEFMPSFRFPKAHLDRLEQELTRNGHLLQTRTAGGEDQHAGVVTSTPVRRDTARHSHRNTSMSGPSSVVPAPPDEFSRNPDLGRSVHFDPALPDSKGKARDYGPSTPYINGRRHTLGGSSAPQTHSEDDHAAEERIRVRQSLPLLPSAPRGIRSADDSFVGTVSTSFSFRRPRRRESLSFVQQPKPRSASVEPEPPIQISEDDESVVVHIGVETAIQTMSENHGFNAEIVRRAWSQTQSLRKTDAVLRQMREAAEKAALQFMENLHDESSLPADPGAVVRGRPLAYGGSPRRSSHNREASVLRITPAEADEETSSEYSPPKPTRAGQYVRLVKEGRPYEAVTREISYATGISPSHTPQRNDIDKDRRGTTSPDAALQGFNTPDEYRQPDPPPNISRWNGLGFDPAKIAIGKRLGQMLANINA
ncbi:uncharacterized protein B0H18DRAFT_991709 [Fomitopsis serialis]|uniref:uncharacterized protein n=1 Tax=Fomitopsis serialis TaxID=139415 RepID=UPI002007D4C9|nr:uncharacterized protein B0H18DRAFT_991709 [Neoantrodia serialis]KAH9930886.1 hypothetical protein B0H18DRAFT_991709 [Neoantrodia serialis]